MNNFKRRTIPFLNLNVVRDFRVRLGKTQVEVARSCGLTANDLTRMEKGKNMSLQKYRIVAEYLGISVDAIVRNDIRAAAAYVQEPPKVVRNLQEKICKSNAEHDVVGNLGEDWVCKKERQKLAGTGYEKLVNPNYANDPDAHFDIQSYNCETFEPVKIEVKATKGNGDAEFYMSDGEYALLRHCFHSKLRYELHRVAYVLNPKKCSEVIYSAGDVLSEFEFIPIRYAVRRKRRAKA